MMKISELTPEEVEQKMKSAENITILDVREDDEWESGHIEGAVHIPLWQLPQSLDRLDPQDETVVVCHSGGRSLRACEYLSSLGYRVTNMAGGMSSWRGHTIRGR